MPSASHSSTLTSAVKSNFFLEIFRECPLPTNTMAMTEWERTAECARWAMSARNFAAFVFRYISPDRQMGRPWEKVRHLIPRKAI